MRFPCRAQSDGVEKAVVQPPRCRGKAATKGLPLAVFGIVAVLLTGACVQQQAETEAFPGFGFGEGKNNMLDYPEDPGRTEYTGERLGHRSRGDVIVAVDNAQARPIPEPEPIQSMGTKGVQAEIDQNSPLSGVDGPIRPTPLLAGDVELEDVQVNDVRTPEAPRRPPEDARSTPAGLWRIGVFLASYRSDARARAGWAGVKRRFSEQFEGLRAEVLEVDLGPSKGGIYYLLFVVPLADRPRAAAVCRALEQADQFCRTATAGGRIHW